MPVLYKLNQDKRETSKTKGKWYARSVQVGTIDIEGLAKIMQANCTIKAADIKAVLTELVETMSAQLQSSMRVKLDGLGAFKIGLKTKAAATAKDFSASQNVVGMRVNFQPELRKDANGTRRKSLVNGAKVMEAPKNAVVTTPDPATKS
jgi:predicted histone-like DNA-binding protein